MRDMKSDYWQVPFAEQDKCKTHPQLAHVCSKNVRKCLLGSLMLRPWFND